MEDDFKKDHAGNEGAKSGSTKISFNIKNIINPTGFMLMINIVSIIFWVLHHSYKYIGWINVSSSPRDKNGKSSLTAQNIKFSIKDFFSKCKQIRRKLLGDSYLLKKSLMENFLTHLFLVPNWSIKIGLNVSYKDPLEKIVRT